MIILQQAAFSMTVQNAMVKNGLIKWKMKIQYPILEI